MKGEAVYLRHLEIGDAQSLLNMRKKNEHFLQPFEPIRADNYLTLEEQRRMIVNGLLAAENDQGFVYGIFLRESDALIGRIELSGIARGPFQNGYLGYLMDKDYNGRGYTTEGVSLCIAYAFGKLRLHRVQAAVMPRNLASIRVLEKVGFRNEGLAKKYLNINGQWEDHALYAMTTEDWKASASYKDE